MEKEDFVKLIMPVTSRHSLHQTSQVRSFVDNALREVACNQFNSESEKIRYLIDALYSIRDFTIALTTENSLRVSLMQQFENIESEIELGNGTDLPEENAQQKVEESLEQDQ